MSRADGHSSPRKHMSCVQMHDIAVGSYWIPKIDFEFLPDQIVEISDNEDSKTRRRSAWPNVETMEELPRNLPTTCHSGNPVLLPSKGHFTYHLENNLIHQWLV